MKKSSPQSGSGARWGLSGGLIASLCCLGPTVAALFGLTGATFLFSMLKYRPYFLALGLIFMLAGVGLALRRSRQSCDVTQHRRNLWLFPGVALLSFAVSYGMLTYIAPTLVYRWLTPAASVSRSVEAAANAPVVPVLEGVPEATMFEGASNGASNGEGSTKAEVGIATSSAGVENAPPGSEQIFPEAGAADDGSAEAQVDTVAVPSPEAESAVSALEPVETSPQAAGGLRRATLAIQGMT